MSGIVLRTLIYLSILIVLHSAIVNISLSVRIDVLPFISQVPENKKDHLVTELNTQLRIKGKRHEQVINRKPNENDKQNGKVSSHSVAVSRLSPAQANKSEEKEGDGVYRYPLCIDDSGEEGIDPSVSDQLLFLGAKLAHVLQNDDEYNTIEIPNRLYLGSSQAKVPLTDFLDVHHLQTEVQLLSKGRIRARIVNDTSVWKFPCDNLDQALTQANAKAKPQVLLQVMQSALLPSRPMQALIEQMLTTAGTKVMNFTTDKQSQNQTYASTKIVHEASEAGICFQTSSSQGADLFSRIKNFFQTSSSQSSDQLEKLQLLGRIKNFYSSTSSIYANSSVSTGEKERRWIYRFGGNNEFISGEFGYPVLSKNELISNNSLSFFQSLAVKAITPVTLSSMEHQYLENEILAVVDFFMCRNLRQYVGNSTNIFSAVQIALKQSSKAYWYGSPSIPLGMEWRVYPMPIVYTYTELSSEMGRYLLKASITSARQHMPTNPIHVIYHGTKSKSFKRWLEGNQVFIHQHNPEWKDAIENMRKGGNLATSHLFAHSGNYLGTWQRIDIPLFIDTEYVLLLDYDTIITRPFTLTDFGQHLTQKVAMSSEMVHEHRARNAGVMVMNIPLLRKTYDKFILFIKNHTSPMFGAHPINPSDQGAYLEFYEPDYLSTCFNFKSYHDLNSLPMECQEDGGDPFIIHFHGPKPHEYLEIARTGNCTIPGFKKLWKLAKKVPRTLCKFMKAFARASLPGEKSVFCEEAMGGKNASDVHFCSRALKMFAKEEKEWCFFSTVKSAEKEINLASVIKRPVASRHKFRKENGTKIVSNT